MTTESVLSAPDTQGEASKTAFFAAEPQDHSEGVDVVVRDGTWRDSQTLTKVIIVHTSSLRG